MTKLNTIDVIKLSAYETSLNGYIKRSDNNMVECTADTVLDMITSNSVDDSELSKMNERIKLWHEYISNENQSGDYFDSVRSEIVKPMIDESKIGLIASSFASFDRHNALKFKHEYDKQYEFLGEEGDSIKFKITSYDLVKSGNSKYGNGNSKWYLYKIYAEDSTNNHGIITWFADRDYSLEFKSFNHATAIISKLTTYNEIKQTNVKSLSFIK